MDNVHLPDRNKGILVPEKLYNLPHIIDNWGIFGTCPILYNLRQFSNSYYTQLNTLCFDRLHKALQISMCLSKVTKEKLKVCPSVSVDATMSTVSGMPTWYWSFPIETIESLISSENIHQIRKVQNLEILENISHIYRHLIIYECKVLEQQRPRPGPHQTRNFDAGPLVTRLSPFVNHITLKIFPYSHLATGDFTEPDKGLGRFLCQFPFLRKLHIYMQESNLSQFPYRDAVFELTKIINYLKSTPHFAENLTELRILVNDSQLLLSQAIQAIQNVRIVGKPEPKINFEIRITIPQHLDDISTLLFNHSQIIDILEIQLLLDESTSSQAFEQYHENTVRFNLLRLKSLLTKLKIIQDERAEADKMDIFNIPEVDQWSQLKYLKISGYAHELGLTHILVRAPKLETLILRNLDLNIFHEGITGQTLKTDVLLRTFVKERLPLLEYLEINGGYSERSGFELKNYLHMLLGADVQIKVFSDGNYVLGP